MSKSDTLNETNGKKQEPDIKVKFPKIEIQHANTRMQRKTLICNLIIKTCSKTSGRGLFILIQILREKHLLFLF